MKAKHIILLSIVPLSEIKAIFYNVDMAVSGYLFSDHKRQLCLVVEDYCNIIIFSIVFWYLFEAYRSKIMGHIALYLFVLNTLDFVHLGLYNMQGFIMLKLFLAYVIYYKLWSKLKHSY